VRVYYTRSSLSGEGAERTADYKLDIRPQGGGSLQREAHLTLARQDDGTWRVVRFHETQPGR
jgi:ketosteroid isomerase-like protein